jgi:hypothetical protein
MGSRSPNFFNISIFLWVLFDRTELCFNAFEWFYMIYLVHLNDFYEFGSIEPNSKKNRNIEKIPFASIELIRLNSIRFDIPGKFYSFTVPSILFFEIFNMFYRIKLIKHNFFLIKFQIILRWFSRTLEKLVPNIVSDRNASDRIGSNRNVSDFF